jgi:mRNA interferase MazF
MAITSQLQPAPTVGEAAVLHWQEASLLKPSIIKPLVTTIETNLVLRQLGTLHAEDQDSLRKILAAIIG